MTLTHMLISAGGQIIDYKKLGDLMVRDGIKKYHVFILTFFSAVLERGAIALRPAVAA